ncbi:leucine-rich repeat domain-containing protein [Photobacterium sp.]|uniref:leucine-rich repeat domain-containing protein n=1 Tax=Photobacterium sp. TaxID=660 RepID=UPI00299E7512|nr:leucine-rich repeat domain-containing protein [Photobacterium sp.]MDX1303225.1 hypothetical protein [Photobacterium sp.]
MFTSLNIKRALLLASAISLTGCRWHGHSENDGSAHPSVPITFTKISGQVFKGPLAQANIVAFDAAGNQLGTTDTDAKGYYLLPLSSQYQGVIRIEASGGEYIDEASGELTQLIGSIQAAKEVSTTDPVINVTLLTELAVRKAEASSAGLTAESVAAANRKVAESMALELDIVSEAPVDLLDPINQEQIGERVDYALVIAGMTKLAQTDSIQIGEVVDKFSDDLADNGELDDIEQLNRLNQGINDFIDSDNNKVVVDKETTSKDEDFYRNTPPVVASLVELSLTERQQGQIAPAITDDKDGLTYQWRQLSGSAAAMADADTAALTITPADTTQTTELTFSLTVTDLGGLSSHQTYRVKVAPAPVISGVAFKGPLTGATVTAYQLDKTEIGQTTTSDNGDYLIKNYGLYQGPVVVQVTGGQYVNEATGQTDTLLQPLQAASNLQLSDTTINITPLTELAVRRALALAPELTIDNIGQANTEIAQSFSINGSLVTTTPTNLMDGDNQGIVGVATDYALAIAGAMMSIDAEAKTLTQWLDNLALDLNDNGQLDDVSSLNALNSGVNNFITSPQNVAHLSIHNTELDTVFYRNTAPQVNPLTDRVSYEREALNISAIVNDDKGNIAYQWQQTQGTTVNFTGSSSSRETVEITLPSLTRSEEMVFKVTVTDEGGLTDTETVSVTVNAYPSIDLNAITDSQFLKCVSDGLNGASDTGSLTRLACDYSHPNIAQLTGIEQFVNLDSFTIYGSNTLTALSPLLSLSKLKYLYIRTAALTDISPLQALPNLEQVNITNNINLTDFSSLPLFPKLKGIDITGTGFSDTTIFKSLPYLTNLAISDTPVRDISFLEDLPNLTSISLYNLALTDISKLALLPELTFVNLTNNQITDLTPLTGLSRISRLNLSNNLITDFSPVAGLSNLSYLGVGSNPVSEISFVTGLQRLSSLDLRSLNITDLTPLANLNLLSQVVLHASTVTDLSVFSTMKNIQTVYFAGYKGNDLSPFIDVKKLLGNRLSTVYLESAPNVPCAQITSLENAGVSTSVTINSGVTCAAN